MKLQEARSQPPLLPQISIGPTPVLVEEVIPRAAIDLDDGYFVWAANFGLLSDAYIHGVAPCVPAGGWTQMYPQKPRSEGGDCHYLKVNDAELRVDYLQPFGWIIELWQEIDGEPDARILTLILGDMPVLCSSFRTAVLLAEASLPTPHGVVYWRSVFQ
jgi:hypothetical protein